MGHFSRARGTSKIVAHGSESYQSSSDPTRKHRSYGSSREPPEKAHIQDTDPGKPVNSSKKPPDLHDPRTSYPSQEQDILQVVERSAKDLIEEAFYKITSETGTSYPCTQTELDASGGVNRYRASSARNSKDKRPWFAQANNGPFCNIRIAAQEVFDHNDPTRTPSVAESEAISRLITGFKMAGQKFWGPDLAIKTFCDLDEVFFCGRLRGHVCLTWQPDRFFAKHLLGHTVYLGGGKCVIELNADNIFFHPVYYSCFNQMFATLLHEMCHAYQQVRALDSGPAGWQAGKPGGHGKNFGTMIHAVNRRAKELLNLKGDDVPYPRHEYALGDDPRPAPKQSPPHQPFPLNPSRAAASPKSPKGRYDDAFRHVFLDSGTDYECTQSDLDVTGALARRECPTDSREGREACGKEWFPQRNEGPFVSPRQACLDIYNHNTSRRKPGNLELEAIARLQKAITAGRRGSWGPDLIIKAFCDIDIVFFRGRLRDHVCLRWLPDWSEHRCTTWGSTIYLGESKCAINLNADTILCKYRQPLEGMFATMLHEMCRADALTQVIEGEMMKCASHGKNFGTRYYAVNKRANKLFNLSLMVIPEVKYPQHKYEKGEGYP